MQLNIKSLIFFIIQRSLFRLTSAGTKWHIITWDLKLFFLKLDLSHAAFS